MSDISIDQATGRLKIISRGWEFGPGLALEQFEPSETAKSATRISDIPPHFQIRTRLADGHFAGLLLIFWNHSLGKIVLVLSDKEELTWDEWSKEGELSRKKGHDDFLREQLGSPPYDFAWGRVMSVIDPHDSTARISIRYKC